MNEAGARGPRLLVVLGPTGTGKSDLGLALARALNGEIVGCDALQIYRGFDCATATPSIEDRAAVPHHLVDRIDPRTDCSLAEYVRLAECVIREIGARDRIPIVVGGTGMYLRGLLHGVIHAPPRDPELRSRLRAVLAGGGARHLRRWLVARDPASARRIAPADTQRMIRALEMIVQNARWSDRLSVSGSWASGAERYPTVKIGLDMDRDALAGRLDRRVAQFLDAGLVQEVRKLLERGIPREANAFKAIGYREVLRRLIERSPLEDAVGEIQRNTRRYAKRQRSWFRKEPGVVWFDAESGPSVLLERALGVWRAAVEVPPVARVILGRGGVRVDVEDAMDAETRNLQNDFFNNARREKSIVTVFLANGKKLVGRIKSFDKFTILLDGSPGEQIVFKHAISTVSLSARSAEISEDSQRRRVETAGTRGPHA
jgi:tRNA dimethylallyltransferase